MKIQEANNYFNINPVKKLVTDYPTETIIALVTLGLVAHLFCRNYRSVPSYDLSFPPPPKHTLNSKQQDQLKAYMPSTSPECKSSSSSQGPQYMGIAWATNMTSKKPTPHVIQVIEASKGGATISAINLETGMSSGGAKVQFFRLASSGRVECPDLLISMDCNARYGKKQDPQEKIHLDQLKVSENYKGLGTAIIKAILQKYGKEFEGRLDTEAGYIAHGFYYKLGLRSPNDVVNQEIARLMGNTGKLMSQNMYLTNGAWKKWRDEIARNPIAIPAITT